MWDSPFSFPDELDMDRYCDVSWAPPAEPEPNEPDPWLSRALDGRLYLLGIFLFLSLIQGGRTTFGSDSWVDWTPLRLLWRVAFFWKRRFFDVARWLGLVGPFGSGMWCESIRKF